MDQELDDIASAFTNTRALDGQNSPTANLPMGGRRHVNVAAAASATDYLRVNEFITNVPIYVVDDNNSTTALSVSATFYATVSATQQPPNGAQLYVETTFGVSAAVGGKSASVDMVLATPQGAHSGDIQLADGHPPYPGQIRGIGHYVYSSTQSAWILMNPWPHAPIFTMRGKARDSANTTAGVDGSSVFCRAARTGNIVIFELSEPVSVSVSISAKELYLSGLPSWVFNGRDQGNPADRVEAFKDSSAISLYAVASTDWIEYRTVDAIDSFPLTPHVLSADTIIRLPAHHAKWLAFD